MKHSRTHAETPSRKQDHVLLTVHEDVAFRTKRTGFEQWEFVHNALPELNFDEISTETTFLSKKLSFPFIISSMTGGYADARRINKNLAEVCEEHRVAMGVGSERQALENPAFHSSYSIVREAAPSIPIIGNIGAAEVARMNDIAPAQRLVELIRADAFAVHLNPLQEFLQPEGNTNFRGVLTGIERLVRGLSIPVIVKEIGAGISKSVAQRLLNIGVSIIDIAGAGGTSWAGVEILRRKKIKHAASGAKSGSTVSDKNLTQRLSEQFWDWGIPTAEALVNTASLKTSFPSLVLIASGGITNGVETAKAIALGADITASARPMMQQLFTGGKKLLSQHLDQWRREVQGVMFLTGARTIEELHSVQIIHRHI
jgi:isopentenyl-diphosphate delta-isomerase